MPTPYERLFRGKRRLVQSHRGLDIGARDAARYLGRALQAPLICATVTRLLVDLNRSARHPGLFSEVTRPLPAAEKQEILARHYHPYRELVGGWIAGALRRGERVIHLSVHSFTPVLNGVPRQADAGLLFDPARMREARFCRDWQARLAHCGTPWIVRRNYPYRGTADGLVVELRRRFRAANYLGVELELNQALLAGADCRRAFLRDLALTLRVG